ncbi:hypothetical protein Ctha_2536 [Chloroherpeton thalassium ATCC 35110]|uniref:Fibronectin type III domain protein n=1 Tax=Chloroherpeton thalassium (strain ATCC 35110 / GB-78) TaxID=517418 RepID=B3QXS0_CHLT3|nr:hypothetical protein [Chloroherpeton thalassium]ACF14985.1 hypothetical protein Ctha_2536 [Chloroherpeton thalassium ATCC 35110]
MINNITRNILERIRLAILPAAFLVFAVSCTDDELTSTPSSPQFVEKSSDTATYDQGIRPIYISDPEDDAGVYLQWHNNTEKDLEGYKLYRTTETTPSNGEDVPINFQLLKTIPLGSQDTKQLPDTAYEDYSVDLNTTYYYRLTAYSSSDGESLPSSEKPSYYLTAGVTLLEPSGSFSMPEDSSITFSWQSSVSFSGGTYLLKVYSIDDYTGEETIVSQTSLVDGFAALENIEVTVSYKTLGEFGGYSFSGSNERTVIYNELESSGTSSYGQRYYWRVYFLSSGIDNLVGSITEGSFEITN